MISTKGTRNVGGAIVDTHEVYVGTRLATHGEMAKRIAGLEAALRALASDDLYLRNASSWHDAGLLTQGVQEIARKALAR